MRIATEADLGALRTLLADAGVRDDAAVLVRAGNTLVLDHPSGGLAAAAQVRILEEGEEVAILAVAGDLPAEEMRARITAIAGAIHVGLAGGAALTR